METKPSWIFHRIEIYILHYILETNTLPKFNMEPENGTLEKEIPSGNYHFQVLC